MSRLIISMILRRGKFKDEAELVHNVDDSSTRTVQQRNGLPQFITQRDRVKCVVVPADIASKWRSAKLLVQEIIKTIYTYTYSTSIFCKQSKVPLRLNVYVRQARFYLA